MRLNAITIEDFLSFGRFEWLDVYPWLNMIVGPNGAGKTNFGRALRAAVDALDYEKRWRWAGAARSGSDRPGFHITLGLTLTGDWERRLVAAFFAAAVCDEQDFQQARSADVINQLITAFGFDSRDLDRLGDYLQQALRPGFLAPLFRGNLRIDLAGGNNWRIDYLPTRTSALQISWRLSGSGSSDIILGSKPVEASFAYSLPMFLEHFSESERSDLAKWIKGQATTPPKLSHERLLAYFASRSVRFSPMVRRPSSGLFAPHRELERLTGEVLEQSHQYDGRWLFHKILGHGFVFTDNVRSTPTDRFDLKALTSAQAIDSASGANLALDLFLKKNGNFESRKLYAEVLSRFTAITDSRFDVVLGPPGLQRLARGVEVEANEGQVPIDIQIEVGRREFPLAFSGAGLTEALFVSTILSETNDRVVLLDEPASNLHRGMQARLVREITSQTRGQFFVITHSASMLPGTSINRASRFARHDGQSVRASPRSAMASLSASLAEEIYRRTDTKALLFANGVILVEGYEETGAFSSWAGGRLERHNVAVYSVNGDKSFGNYIRFLLAFRVPWAVFCDGKLIGDEKPSRISRQLKDLGVTVNVGENLSFQELSAALKNYGIYTLAKKTEDEFADVLGIINEHRAEAESATGKTLKKGKRQSKPVIIRYISTTYPNPCPPELSSILDEIIDWLESGRSLGFSSANSP